ncbi:zincin-like metallopeptidase toxin domain-containing protein [Fibrella forsythiae]|uniref:Tox-MPTase4 domain-containing protein n=1 Tax=Fibrella forsythiae TaxID=2817061 RepID=A0ABS3JRN2_9BACT|nr:zincin-like metallopeptidase toxin domain-containing protein [Fibrella forsythiae]MBO0952672.1 hypothetical protein [Fibrella forsythiae]
MDDYQIRLLTPSRRATLKTISFPVPIAPACKPILSPKIAEEALCKCTSASDPLSKFKEQDKSLGDELEVVKDKKVIKMMDKANAQAGFDAAANKVYVRKGATAYEVAHEMTHAKQCAELGKDAYGKLSRLKKIMCLIN